MSEVLYRKWRPPKFSEIVGQDAVTQTLRQAIATGRTAHAYLLCGPRGTGKTSTARVIAKALNCEMRPQGVGDPCGACNSCKAIEQGNFVDLIEIDAASNRGIDEMRDLREKVRYAPTQGKYKVYIIDEAHALTGPAAEAFLKTLEEPPPHTVFILATTDPQKLPATIVSRCQRYDFHRISPADVVDRLSEIAQSEHVDVSPEVLRTVARAAGGSLRDATNHLDQLITSFGANVSIDQVRELLGMGGEERAIALTKHLLTGNTTAALELINKVAGEGQDLRPLHRMTTDFLRAALLMKSGVKDSLELSKEASAEISFAANSVTIEHILRALRVFGQVSLKFDQPSPLPLELATVELSLEPPAVAAPAPAAQAPAPAPSAPPYQQQPQRPSMPQPSRPSAPQPQARPQSAQQRPAAQAPHPAAPPPVEVDPNAPPNERLTAQWPNILRALSRVPKRRFKIDALLRSSSKRSVEGNELVVHFSHVSNTERLQTELEDPRCRLEVERILSQVLGEGITLRVETDDGRKQAAMARNQGSGGHLVRAAMSLGGHVVQQNVPSHSMPSVANGAPLPNIEDYPSNSNGAGRYDDDAPTTSEAKPAGAEEAAEPVGEQQSEAAPGSELSYEPIVEKPAAEPASNTTEDAPEKTSPPQAGAAANAEADSEASEEPTAAGIPSEEPAPAGDEPPAMARNLFNEMQAVPRFTDDEDEDAEDDRPAPSRQQAAPPSPQQAPARETASRQRREVDSDFFPPPDDDFDP